MCCTAYTTTAINKNNVRENNKKLQLYGILLKQYLKGALCSIVAILPYSKFQGCVVCWVCRRFDLCPI